MPITDFLSALATQASGNPSLCLALIVFFFLTASLVGGLGRLIFIALMTLRSARLLFGVGLLGSAGMHFM